MKFHGYALFCLNVFLSGFGLAAVLDGLNFMSNWLEYACGVGFTLLSGLFLPIAYGEKNAQ
jgi:uncharacterized protein YebE (UPF0316 family)